MTQGRDLRGWVARARTSVAVPLLGRFPEQREALFLVADRLPGQLHRHARPRQRKKPARFRWLLETGGKAVLVIRQKDPRNEKVDAHTPEPIPTDFGRGLLLHRPGGTCDAVELRGPDSTCDCGSLRVGMGKEVPAASSGSSATVPKTVCMLPRVGQRAREILPRAGPGGQAAGPVLTRACAGAAGSP